MNEAVEACRAKVARAQHHLQSINDTLKPFVHPAGNPLKRYEHVNGTEYLYRVEFGRPFPDLSCIVGDVLHNLHSALDNWAWGVVAAHGTIPEGGKSGVQFPIYPTPKGYKGTISKRLPGVSADIRTAVERLQPWYGGKDPYFHPMFWLYELSIYDKHRSPHISWVLGGDNTDPSRPSIISVQPKGFNIEVGIYGGDIEDGAVVAWARGANLPKVNVNVGYAIRVGIDKVGCLPKDLALGCLGDIFETVRDAIAALEPFLTAP